jgi:hypothetical protein
VDIFDKTKAMKQFKRPILILLAVFLGSVAQSAKPVVPIIKLTPEHELKIKTPTQGEGARNFVSAASGLVVKGEKIFIVSDDERSLYTFSKTEKTLEPFTLIEGALPSKKEERKKLKPDFESLIHVSEKDWPPHGALVAWPSGSGIDRMTAVTVPFNGKGEFEKPMISNITPLAYVLNGQAKDLNIEGLLIRDKKVFLFQRGNEKSSKNGIFELPLADWLNGLKTGEWRVKPLFEKFKVGKLNGIKLGITDVVLTKAGALAVAAAEDTGSAFTDGMIHGSVLVRLTGNEAQILGRFEPLLKIEGIAVKEESPDGSLTLYLVDDADDPLKASRLWTATISSQNLVLLTQ